MNTPDVTSRLTSDVWRMVFRKACTDGGYIGCALASTSRSVRQLSASTRFYSVSLDDLAHIQKFLTCLARVQQQDTETPVQHLWLSFLTPTRKSPLRPRRVQETELRDREEDKNWWDSVFVEYVSRLFERVGPTLQTLLVLQSGEIHLPFVRYHFPALREITLLGDDCMFVRVPPTSEARTSRWTDPADVHLYHVPIPDARGSLGAPFPSLKRLHIVYAFPKLCSWEQTLPLWAVLAPAVTHLRISGGNAGVALMLQDLLGLRPDVPPLGVVTNDCVDALSGENTWIVPSTPVYPSLRLVIVQPIRLPNWVSDKSKRDFDVALRHHLEHIAQVCGVSDSKAWVTVLRSRRYCHDYWPLRLKWEWRDRMRGGGGCWTEDELAESGRRGPTGEPLRQQKVVLPLEAEKRIGPVAKSKWWKVLWSYISKAHGP
ncbi:hypothetical protein C8Q78DRAFT_1009064 [Trametes maxima]|nr:hypothetical protein C8Q78DRAFT_1009064 [Trametes maxima]